MKKKFDRSRWRAFFLAVLLAAEMFTAGTHIRAASVAEEDLFTYFISGNEVTITGTTSLAGKDLVIPDTLEGKPVTAIRGRRFLGPKEGNTGGPEPRLSGLTSVEIPASVTEIGSGAFLFCPELTSITVNEENPVYHSAGNCLIKTKAKELIAVCKTSTIPSDGSVISIGEGVFSGCNRLTSIELPSSVTKIGDFAFSHCTELTSIKIPGVTSIGYAAFWGCTGLASIELPSGVTSIGTCAFFDCTGLTSIEIPDGVTTIDGYAFEGCTGLTSIEIPSSVTSIGGEAFWGCTGLGSIVVNEGNPAYHSAGNCLIETKTKELIAGCKTSIIPSDGSVTEIGDDAFAGTGLTSIEIPASVTTISKYAFLQCPNLTIRGYSGTRAESFAGKNGIPFYEIVFGDLDKKDGVGSADAVYLLMHVFYPEDYPVAQLCDFNGDSKVDSADAVYLLMYVFYPEDYPLPQ